MAILQSEFTFPGCSICIYVEQMILRLPGRTQSSRDVEDRPSHKTSGGRRRHGWSFLEIYYFAFHSFLPFLIYGVIARCIIILLEVIIPYIVIIYEVILLYIIIIYEVLVPCIIIIHDVIVSYIIILHEVIVPYIIILHEVSVPYIIVLLSSVVAVVVMQHLSPETEFLPRRSGIKSRVKFIVVKLAIE